MFLEELAKNYYTPAENRTLGVAVKAPNVTNYTTGAFELTSNYFLFVYIIICFIGQWCWGRSVRQSVSICGLGK